MVAGLDSFFTTLYLESHTTSVGACGDGRESWRLLELQRCKRRLPRVRRGTKRRQRSLALRGNLAMTRMRTLLGAGAAALALTATGCSGGGDADGPVELTFWHGYTEADGDVLEEIVEEVNASHEDITIKTEVKTWAGIDDTLLTALSAQEGPALVAMPSERLPVYASRGAFVPLDEFYEGDDAAANLVPG